ncbi:PhnA domain-containing protein [Pseudoalteromonas sp. MMG013]|uniref:Phosphonoacetate hydrolase n=1 Tax=Pseudoalteromonas aurantia 208 TaxID=1314867 RepID=A0ABR9E5I4_9GAMM|nr:MULTISPECIES: alkylphosphonate utilization protein [Pseudoalteromonas]MBE0366256.1 phosphonoacetate hydrolase [Pseudoalteromonas aurantia 208]MBQ4846503.1 PhnA domain-containing protein [Pseudoalteromonas sp. MMG005]MBQ4849408.1 PhnA domain-containing protein [Pseudoalteromonas sp. MMG012]MBQ4862348.1 PhnA domain-containing protein [Pseudoalteromonas sp. MMG013]
MSIAATLAQRSNGQCELCSNNTGLDVFEVPPVNEAHSDKCVYLCSTCKPQVEGNETLQTNHWHCLNDSMWSQTPAVQVVAFRLLSQLAVEHSWAQDALDMLYLEDDTRTWAAQVLADEDEIVHLDSNGVRLNAGDTVVLIKDLDVKGSSIVAKRGTAVRNIGLTSNPDHIEGRVDGQRIVILTKFVKK